MKHKRYIVLAALLTAACSGQYAGIPRAEVLAYQTGRTQGDLHSLALAYAESLNAAVQADTLHPGMYAEYGVTMALLGRKGEATRMLNAEAAFFPESKGIVQALKRQLNLDLSDQAAVEGRPTANIGRLEELGFTGADAKKPLHNVASIIDSTDTLRVMLQTPVDSFEYQVRLTANQKRQMLYEEQHRAEMRVKEVKDSIAAAKQAKLDARKQAKKAKKQAAKAKKKSRK